MNQDLKEIKSDSASLDLVSNCDEYADYLWMKAGKPDQFSKVFVFQKKMYLAVKKKDMCVEMLADAAIGIKFVQISERGDHSLILEVNSEPKTWHVHLKSKDLLGTLFSDIVSEKTRHWVTREPRLLMLLYRYLNKGNLPTIRSTGVYGYDKKTRWYTFHNFAVDPSGKIILPEPGSTHFCISENQYICGEQQFREAVKKPCDEDLGIQDFVREIQEAYGEHGLIAIGYWVASLFSQPVFDHLGFFPFLSMYGTPGAGKSTLGKICNRALSFADWEGIPLSRTNTAKGPQRQLAAQSSVAVPLLEWSEKSKMAEEDLLNLYGRNPQQIRAAATNDGTYIAVPFNCSLVLIQNEEPFTLRQVKERIVSLKFEKENVTAETAMASKRLLNRRPEITATVGIQLLRNRKYFEEKIVQELGDMASMLEASGINDRRICDNYAVPLAGLRALVGWLEKDQLISEKESQDWITDAGNAAIRSALEKLSNAYTELLYAEEFLQRLDEEVDDKVNRVSKYGHQHASDFATIDGDVLITHVNRALDEWNYSHHIRPLLKRELRKHERYVDHRSNSTVFNKKKEKVWKFNKLVD